MSDGYVDDHTGPMLDPADPAWGEQQVLPETADLFVYVGYQVDDAITWDLVITKSGTPFRRVSERIPEEALRIRASWYASNNRYETLDENVRRFVSNSQYMLADQSVDLSAPRDEAQPIRLLLQPPLPPLNPDDFQ